MVGIFLGWAENEFRQAAGWGQPLAVLDEFSSSKPLL